MAPREMDEQSEMLLRFDSVWRSLFSYEFLSSDFSKLFLILFYVDVWSFVLSMSSTNATAVMTSQFIFWRFILVSILRLCPSNRFLRELTLYVLRDPSFFDIICGV